MSAIIETDVLVIGAGPAGASTTLFLAKHGVSVTAISRHRGTSNTPRAHIVNQRTMEVLRDGGIERDCLDAASPGRLLENFFWLDSMAGNELGRCWAWGNDPARLGDYASASPCTMLDLPQDRMEPLLITEATRLGANIRFGWELSSFAQDETGVTAQITDRLSGGTVTVRCKYMVGADGGRSRVVEALGLPMTGRRGLGELFNVHCEIDLSDQVKDRQASLYTVIQPGALGWGPTAVYRMVRPWDLWIVSMAIPKGREGIEPSIEDFEARIRETAGVASKPVHIRSVSRWQINDVVADHFAVGRVFCMGDAVHLHPPANALGSNTCIQDGFNLAWKLAYVLQGKAHPALLDSFNDERQPVGQQIVQRANKSMGQAIGIVGKMGIGAQGEGSEPGRLAVFQTAEGRALMREELGKVRYNGLAHGVEMTRRYCSGAVIPDGTAEPVATRDAELYYEPTTWPGSSLPHVWLTKRQAGPRVSTLDVAGKGGFRLFIGHEGDAWRHAAAQVDAQYKMTVGVTSVGALLDYEDPYGDWFRLRGVQDDGCVLVRPDLIVAWRCNSLPDNPTETLVQVMGRLLGWDRGAAA